MVVDFEHYDGAGLVKVIEKANTGSPRILAEKIIQSEWFQGELVAYAIENERESGELGG